MRIRRPRVTGAVAAGPPMNMVRELGTGAAAAGAAGATRVPQDPQNANPGAIGLPQLTQMSSPDAAGPAPPTSPGMTLPMAGVPPPLETLPRAAAGDTPAADANVLAGGGACDAGGDCS